MRHPYRYQAILFAFSLFCTAPAAAQARGSTVPTLSDPEIAHVAVTANAIDAELGQFASAAAASEAVRRFAQTMVTDHTLVNERAAALAARLGVTPADNAVSQSLRAGATPVKVQLQGLRGEAFDRAYIDREVVYHQAVLDALDGLLIPSAKNAELRALLQEVRPAITAHLEHARSLQHSLAGGH